MVNKLVLVLFILVLFVDVVYVGVLVDKEWERNEGGRGFCNLHEVQLLGVMLSSADSL